MVTIVDYLLGLGLPDTLTTDPATDPAVVSGLLPVPDRSGGCVVRAHRRRAVHRRAGPQPGRPVAGA